MSGVEKRNRTFDYESSVHYALSRAKGLEHPCAATAGDDSFPLRAIPSALYRKEGSSHSSSDLVSTVIPAVQRHETRLGLVTICPCDSAEMAKMRCCMRYAILSAWLRCSTTFLKLLKLPLCRSFASFHYPRHQDDIMFHPRCQMCGGRQHGLKGIHAF